MTNGSLSVGFFLALLASGYSGADSDVKFHGTLYKISCMINSDKAVDVTFGNVGVNKIDGIQYTQPVPLTLTCDESYQGSLMLSLTGNVSDFDNSAVTTDVTDLGIRLMQDGQPVSINTPFLISAGSPPALTAVPVTRPGSALTEGTFHATATLVAEAD